MQKGILSGHLFNAYLVCPQRAWLDLYGNKEKRLYSPRLMTSLIRSGLSHEKIVEEKFFQSAEKLKNKLSNEERLRKTEDLLRKGVSFILQGAVKGSLGIGVVDVLEHVQIDERSKFGHLYRVGEIKHATNLHSGHIFQALWYRDLLKEWSGVFTNDIFLIDGNFKRRNISAEIYNAQYKNVLKSLLLLSCENQPGPFLSSECPKCSWRGVCIPEMSNRNDLSFLPRLGRAHCSRLFDEGFKSWKSVEKDFERVSNVLQLDSYNQKCLNLALQRLNSREAVTRELLDWDWLGVLQPLVFDISYDQDSFSPQEVLPRNIWTTEAGCIDVKSLTNDQIETLISGSKTVIYGEMDLIGIKNLIQHRNMKISQEPSVMTRLVQAYVHEPLMGYELSCLDAHVNGIHDTQERDLEPEERLKAIIKVRDWIAGKN